MKTLSKTALVAMIVVLVMATAATAFAGRAKHLWPMAGVVAPISS